MLDACVLESVSDLWSGLQAGRVTCEVGDLSDTYDNSTMSERGANEDDMTDEPRRSDQACASKEVQPGGGILANENHDDQELECPGRRQLMTMAIQNHQDEART